MAKIISISNHKGGVGKTTSCVNIAAGLNKLQRMVLLIDLDPQANLSQSLGISHELTIYGALRRQYDLEPIKVFEGLDMVPSTIDLSGAEVELSEEKNREYVLSEILTPVTRSYDYIIIDTPPSLGLLTVNAFTASHEVLIPLQAQYLALQGLTKLLEVIEKIKQGLNEGLRIGGVLITQYNARKILNKNIAEAIKDYFGDKVFDTKIRENIALAEAPTHKVDIFKYQPNSHGAQDYFSLSKELLEKKI